MSSVSQINLRTLSALDQFYNVADLNRLLGDLFQNDRLIADVVETTRIGQANFAYNAPVAGSVQVGQPVFYNRTNGRFERTALATIQTAGRLFASESSEAWGLLTKRCTADRGHLLLSGIASVDLTASTGQAAPSGKLYLSRAAGLMAPLADSAIQAPACLAIGNGEVIFRPWFADTFPRYVASHRTLSTQPAGTLVTSSGQVSIAAANSALPGWLPAGHTSFGGNQPVGAHFGYNFVHDVALAAAWPPLEPALSRIYYESGGSTSRGSRVLLGSETGRLLIDQHGIWWMTNCVGQLPWDMAPEGATGAVTCPKSFPRRMVLEAAYAITSQQPAVYVTSLASLANWLKVYANGSRSTAATGSLQLAVDPSLLINAAIVSLAGRAIKGYQDGQFISGPVVTSLRSSSPSLQINGSEPAPDGQAGVITFELTASKDFDLLPNATQLFSASTEAYADTIAIGLPAGRPASFVSSFHIPSAVPADSTVQFTFWLHAVQTTTLPVGLTCRTRRFSVPPAGTQLAVQPEVDLALNYTAGQGLTAGNYRAVETAPLVVRGGETIYLRFARAGGLDGVGAELQVLKHFGRFVATE